MAKFRGAVVVDKEKCKGCNLCVVACPTKTLDLVCPDSVITVYKMNVQ